MHKEIENDYALLRPFDPLELLHASSLCDREGEPILSQGIIKALRAANREDLLRMAPLGWLDGRPVYHDSLLYNDYFREYQLGGDISNLEALLLEGLLLWGLPKEEETSLVEIYIEGTRIACANIPTSKLAFISSILP